MSASARYDTAADMEREMIAGLKKIGLSTNFTLYEYFCRECGGVVVILSTRFSGEKEFECNDC